MKKLIFWLLKPRWIVEDDGSMGLRLCRLGLNLIYYKWPEPMIGTQPYRFAEKREFGETVKSEAVPNFEQFLTRELDSIV